MLTAADVTTPAISWESVLLAIWEWLKTEGVKIVIGLIVLIIAYKIINVIAKKIKKKMERHNRDKTITIVLYNIIRKGLKILLFVVYLGYIGIDTAGIGTIIASLGVGVGLALQGSLSNLAGGIVILIMRPFKLGDYIEAQGQSGTVEEIKVFYTYLVTPDNRVVMIPNGVLANGSMVNYSMKDLRRVDMQFSVSYEQDFEKAKAVIKQVISQIPQVINDPAPFVRVISHGDSAINIVTRIWVKNSDYWDVYYNMMESIKKRFDEEKIEIPYNQLDVNIKKN